MCFFPKTKLLTTMIYYSLKLLGYKKGFFYQFIQIKNK